MTTGKGIRRRTSAALNSEDRHSTTPIRFRFPDVLFSQMPCFHSACLEGRSCHPCQRLNQTFQPLFKITQKKTKKRFIPVEEDRYAVQTLPLTKKPFLSFQKVYLTYPKATGMPCGLTAAAFSRFICETYKCPTKKVFLL